MALKTVQSIDEACLFLQNEDAILLECQLPDIVPGSSISNTIAALRDSLRPKLFVRLMRNFTVEKDNYLITPDKKSMVWFKVKVDNSHYIPEKDPANQFFVEFPCPQNPFGVHRLGG